MRLGFDNGKYLTLQSAKISERIHQFGGKLYLEFGGKLFDDHHASRVLPGFEPDSKVRMLMKLKDDVEIIVVINADDIEKNKRRGDLGITYDLDALRLIDAFRGIGLYVGSVCITHYREQPAAVGFQNRLEAMGVPVYRHYAIHNYPTDLQLIISRDGFGRNDFIQTSHPLAVVTAPGPGSGKMAVCLSQLYCESLRGNKAGYAKFETFPVWNLPLLHPVNLAYEAATTDLDDVNMIDPFHLESHGVTAVSYNRDVEIFPVLNAIFEKIYGRSPYKSPTDMGVNMISECITDDEICRSASRQEVIRRYYSTRCLVRQGLCEETEVHKLELLMKQLEISPDDRPVVKAACEKAEETGQPAMALLMPDGRMVTGKTSSLLGACSSLMLNTLKTFAGISDGMHLLSPVIIEPIQRLKVNHMGNHNPRLHSDELLIALAICAATNPIASLALEQLPKLKGCEAHSSVILSRVDENVFHKLGVNLTCEPRYQTKKLYHA